MTKIIWYDFNNGEIEGLPTSFDLIKHYNLHEKIVFKGIIYEITDIRSNLDEDNIRIGIIREGTFKG